MSTSFKSTGSTPAPSPLIITSKLSVPENFSLRKLSDSLIWVPILNYSIKELSIINLFVPKAARIRINNARKVIKYFLLPKES